MKPTMKHVIHCGIEGKGATVREAKAEAFALAESIVVDAHKLPHLITIQGYTAVVFRHAWGWTHGLVREDRQATRRGNLCAAIGGGASEEDAICRAITHLAHCAWTLDSNDAELIDTAANMAPRARRDEISRELFRYFAWQRDYARLKAEGATDAEAHDKARGDYSRHLGA